MFIESLLLNVPVPPVFLFERESNWYEVMDGQQRLNAIVEFYENRFPLSGLEKWTALHGRTYADCPPTIQRGLDRRRISAVVLMAESAHGSIGAQKDGGAVPHPLHKARLCFVRPKERLGLVAVEAR